MAASVQILCPNGHRPNIKITQNTKLLQILEEVCVKEGFQPAEEYDLKHGRKVLDLTLTVRFAGLPNHAKLELVRAEKARAETDVIVALQLENGQRLQGAFQPGTSLWGVLLHWQENADSAEKTQLASSEGMHPVMVYMREEVVGEAALKATTLRKLGLTGGKAIIRLLQRPVHAEKLADVQARLDAEKEKQAKLAAKALERQKSEEKEQMESKRTKSSVDSETQEESVETQPPHVPDDSHTLQAEPSGGESGADGLTPGGSTSSSVDQQPMDTENMPRRVPSDSMEIDASASEGRSSEEQMETENSDVVAPPSGEKAQAGQAEAGPSTSTSVSAPGSSSDSDPLTRLASLPGVEVFRPGEATLTPSEEEKARQLAQVLMPGVLPPPRQPLSRQQQQQLLASKKEAQQRTQRPVFPFVDFKFPEETKGQDLYRNEYSDVKKEEFMPCDRETVLFSLDAPRSETGEHTDEFPDDFFEVTEADVRMMWKDIQHKRDTDAGAPLMTSAMRVARQISQIEQYTRVVIRVHFPDRLVLQGVFRPRETVHAVHKFVAEHLEDKSSSFYLYTTPPRSVLKDKAQNLFEANLAPMSLVHLGSDEQRHHYLSAVALQSVSTLDEANKIVQKNMSPTRAGSSTEVAAQASGSSSSGSDSASRGTKSAPGSKAVPKGQGKGLPKWFAAGKK